MNRGVFLGFSCFVLSLTAQAQNLSSKPDVSLFELIQTLTPAEKEHVKKYADAALSQILPAKEYRDGVVGQLGEQLDHPDAEILAHFPTVSPDVFRSGIGQELMPQSQGERVTPAPVMIDDLKTFFAEVRRPRIEPAPTDLLPRLKYGHFPNLVLGEQEHSQSIALAEILNGLARDDGSYVTWGSQRITSVRDLVVRLMLDHVIEFRDERTYANFLSFTVDGTKNLRWPIWIDTGLRVGRQSEPLVIPAGHSQFAWEIHGPMVHAQVTFFLGISGAGFFARVDERPTWTGLRSVKKIRTLLEVANTFDAAVLYLKLNSVERETIARGMPADGYGLVGTCNDSVAILESLARLPMQVYPLIRRPGLRAETRDSDLTDLYDRLARFPSDLSPATELAQRKDQLARISAMNPFLERPNPWDAHVGELMDAVNAELSK